MLEKEINLEIEKVLKDIIDIIVHMNSYKR